MPKAKPLYIIFVEDDTLSAPPAAGDLQYFYNGILPNLRPLSDDEYMNGPAVILRTLARYSYLVYQNDVYWCAEWEPGLVVVRFSPDGSMAWTAVRSPNPEFGGREPLAEDLRDYDDDADNPQYNLVFHAWDAQFDEQCCKHYSFKVASEKTLATYQAALVHVNELCEQLEARYSGSDDYEEWTERCKENLRQWSGEGIRVRL